MTHLFDEKQIMLAKAACLYELPLVFHGLTLHVLADNPAILDYLKQYYASLTASTSPHTLFPHTPPPHAEQRIFLLDRQFNTSGIDWLPVKRNKSSSLGLKEAYVDTSQGRWIHKVRTGMVLFQSLTDPVATGDLTQHRSQVVNFINNQFLNYHQRDGYLLGHASAFDINGSTTAIAASSGGGKSTLMLKALESEKACFLSNDRILFKPQEGQVNVIGVAKHPRVNPGTLLNSERLVTMLTGEECAKLDRMPKSQLWDLEQKYDVLIPNAYGENKTASSGKLGNLVLLDWSLSSMEPTRLSSVDSDKTPEALEGLRKSPGAFFQQADGRFPPEQTQSVETYADNLRGVQVLRLTGSIDFERAIELLQAKGIL